MWMRLSLLCLGLFLCLPGFSQTHPFHGQLTDTQGHPIPFAGLFFKGNNWEFYSSSDFQGNFSIQIPQKGAIQIYLDLNRSKQWIATFKTLDSSRHVLTLSERTERKLRSLNMVPAPDQALHNFIMRQAIQRRNLNLDRLGSFAYTHRVNAVSTVVNSPPAYPRIWLWEAVPDTQDKGNRFFLQYFSQVKSHPSAGFHSEQVQHFRMYGQPESFAQQSTRFSELHLYQQRIYLHGFADFPYVSPLAWDAFFYYRFSGADWHYKGGKKVFTILVQPRNPNTPTFKGEIEVVEGSWELLNVKLTAGKKSGLVLVDSVSIEFEQHETRLGTFPKKRAISAWKQFYGASLNYQWRSEIDSLGFWIGQNAKEMQLRFSMPKEAANFDTDFYEHKFSANTLEQQKLCEMDSLLHSSHFRTVQGHIGQKQKIPWYAPVLGGQLNSHLKGRFFQFDGILNDQFEVNTVEGPTLKWGCSLEQRFQNGWTMRLQPRIRFGFADQQFKSNLVATFWSRKKWQKYTISGGRYLFQINSSEPINHYINTLYTLFFRQNFMKLYQKDYLSLNYEWEPFNGLYIKVGAEYAIRNTLENNFLWSISNIYGNEFTPNNPNALANPTYPLQNNKALILHGGITWRPRQQFIRYLDQKYALNSRGLELSLFADAGVPNALNSQVSYLRFLISLRNEINFGLFGKSTFLVRSGWMAFANALTYLDFTHFLGDQTYFLGNARERVSLDQFRALGYYKYSTRGSYVEGHWQHDFEHTALKEIPVLRSLRWNYLVGANLLMMADATFTPYTEVFFGIDRLLAAVRPLEMFNLRFDIAMQVNETGFQPPVLLLGIGSNFHKVPK